MKAIRLAEDSLPFFRERLRGSIGLGRYLEQHVGGGDLRVLGPQPVDTLDLQRLNEDIFYSQTLDLAAMVTAALARYLETGSERIVTVDTAYGPQDARPASLRWFSVNSPVKPGQIRICAFLCGGLHSGGRVENLFAVASPYPTTVMLTSAAPGCGLRSGLHLNPGDPLFAALVHNVSHVIVGAFDERTMMIWSRNGTGDSLGLD